MRTKLIYIIGGVAAVIMIGVLAVIFGGRGGSPSQGNAPTNVGSNAGAVEAGNAPASKALPNIPTGAYLSIGTAAGTVQVKNFYASDPAVLRDGSVLIVNTADYSITYNALDSSFWIGIAGNKFDAMHGVAEQDLLTVLGVSSPDACKLNASEGIFYEPNNNISGETFPLSFCPGSGALQ